jgi:type IV fimbrial biogenesis protein FimT
MLTLPTRNNNFIHTHGFNLVEMMIVITVIGILTVLAVPNFTAWVQNTKTRTVAEALQNGIRLAQSEAVKSSRNVRFLLTNATPTIGATESTTGRNWVVESMSMTNTAEPDRFVQGASLPDMGNVQITATSAFIQFNSFGRIASPNNSVVYQITNKRSTSSNPLRRLNVTVSVAGAIRMCDPDKELNATNPDGC